MDKRHEDHEEELGKVTAKTFKFNSKYSAQELEDLHRENMISNKINKNSKWSSVSFGGDVGVMMHDD